MKEKLTTTEARIKEQARRRRSKAMIRAYYDANTTAEEKANQKRLEAETRAFSKTRLGELGKCR